jgi:alpha-tubulin suppressor-like RCC1 family protein
MNNYAAAALKSNGEVVTWGTFAVPIGGLGGEATAIPASLSSGVVDIFKTMGAFAALKSDGTVVTWGDNNLGGDSSGVDFSF